MENKIDKVLGELASQGITNMAIEVREGKALELHHLENLKISGAIDAPSRWLTARVGLYNPKESFTYIDRDNHSIKTFVHEQQAVGSYEINGSMEYAKDFVELGINNEKYYKPMQLHKFLKLRRSLFEQASEHISIVTTLKNIKAKINKDMEEAKDDKGNSKKSFEETVESNMPDGFTLCMPLIKGEPNVTFRVDIILEVVQGDIMCYLESVEAQELADEMVTNRIDEEVEKIKDFTTIIEK